MATLKDPPSLPPMPDFSAHNTHFSTAGDMKFHLQNLLDSKEKQLQQAGTLGQRVLAQQMELEERIRQLQEIETDKLEDDEIDPEAQERYRDLAETILSWDAENAQLSSAFGSSSKRHSSAAPSPLIPYAELPRDEPDRSKAAAGTSAAQSRRAKNAAHRADDVEFAFEIGSGLLTEVRRLQSLLGERDKAIQDMKEEKDDLEKSLESLRVALRQQEQSADKFKEENWNLEVTLQDLRTQLSDSQSSSQRLESEHKRLTKALATSRDVGEQQKNEAERLQNVIEEMKAKHETDIAQARKHAAGLARDKSDLQQTIDTMKAETARAGRRLPRFGSPLTPNGAGDRDFLTPDGTDVGDADVFGNTGGASTNRRKLDHSALFPPDGFDDLPDSPEVSPVRKPFLAANHPSNEIEALQQRLAHAQRQITTLKGSLNREKQLRMRLSSSDPLAIEGEEEDGEGFEDEDPTGAEERRGSKRTITPFRVGGRNGRRGRGRGGITLIQRLGMAAGSPSSEFNDDDEPHGLDQSPPPVPPIPIRFNQPDEDDEVSQFFGGEEHKPEDSESRRSISRSPSPSSLAGNGSNRTSVDGMDPAFANVLKRVNSNGSYTGSPLRQSVLGRSARGRTVGRRNRGGVPYKETRPSSLVDAPEVLAAAMGVESPLKGFTGSPMKGEEIPEEDEFAFVRKPVETAEFACQTEPPVEEEAVPPIPPLIVSPPKPETTEMGIQAEPEPQREPPITVEMSMQTDEDPIVEKVDMAMQHTPEAPQVPLPIMVQTEVQTMTSETADVDTQTPIVSTPTADSRSRKETLTQTNTSFASSSGDTTLTRNFLVEAENDDGDETETGADTETDTDDYQDARQSIVMSTPYESQESFHSVLSLSDNGYPDSDDDDDGDDDESIKASRLSSRNASALDSHRAESSHSFYGDVLTREVQYENVGVSADLFELPEPVILVPPKPEVKEMSIQTDEWMPPTPPPAPVPVVTPIPASIPPSTQTSPRLYRVGSANQQFQFVLPSPPATAPTMGSGMSSIGPSPLSSPMSSVFRDTTGTFGPPRNAGPDRRQSIESSISSHPTSGDDIANRPRVPSATLLNPTDKSRPPMMVLPPPPKLPPPPNSMPPPTFIPERRLAAGSTGSHDIPPPRPSSPPPPELIQRATTPTFGAVLSVPGVKGVYNLRQHGSSMPPSQAGLRQLPSTSSFRSAANAASYAPNPVSPGLSSFNVRERERTEFSQTSLMSERSPRSSLSSDHNPFNQPVNNAQAQMVALSPEKSADITPRGHPGAQSTDPVIIHAITQTMIGEFLYKYTRRAIGKGHGERRHRRFFWVHPYTKTLYWSSADPGSSNVSESSAKSAYIEGVRSVLDPNPMPPGLYQYSVVVSTPQREMKITAPTKERHDIWLNALKYLLSRPNAANVTSPGNATVVPLSPGSTNEFPEDERRPRLMSSPQSQRSARQGETWNTTPRGQRSRSQVSVNRSVGKRSGTPAVEYLRWNNVDSPYSPSRSFVDVPGQEDEDLDFELHGESQSDDGFEGLENVRACCDGRHTVGHSGKHHHHHHHHNGPALSRGSTDSQHLLPSPGDLPRPASPAWSFRSKTGSTTSHEGGLFSWGRNGDGKLRFGSRRSGKSSLQADT